MHFMESLLEIPKSLVFQNPFASKNDFKDDIGTTTIILYFFVKSILEYECSFLPSLSYNQIYPDAPSTQENIKIFFLLLKKEKNNNESVTKGIHAVSNETSLLKY